MLIPDDKVEEVRAASDLVEVVGEYVKLKRRGSNFIGLCPFHSEKTPSFNVNPDMGIYKCFGCGAGGDGFQFLMRVENIAFPEAVKQLAQRAGIELPVDENAHREQSQSESIYEVLRFAGRFFYDQLTQETHGKEALNYLIERGFTPSTIKKFGLGYGPDEWNALLKAAESKSIDAEMLEKAGLVIPRKDHSGYYDRYRGRVVFPIFSHVGKVIGFGGRILKPADNQPKYINSPETRVYHKSHVLYGLYQAKRAIRKREEALLVEGYTDVISLHQAGVQQAVATSGTALTNEQIKLLKRYTSKVVLLYDADSAGARAAIRGIDLFLAQGVTVYGLELPDGEDPDSFIRTKGAEAFEAHLYKHRQDFVAFMHSVAKRSGQMETPEGEAQVTRSIIASIALMPDPTMHEPFIRRASHVLGVPDIPLYEALGGIQREQRQKPARKQPEATPPDVYYVEESEYHSDDFDGYALPVEETSREVGVLPLPEEKMLIRLMLNEDSTMVEFVMGNMAMEEFSTGVVQKTVNAILSMYQGGKVTRSRLIDGAYGADVQHLVTEVLMQRYEPSENWAKKQIQVPRFNEDPREVAASTMTKLKKRRVKEVMSELKDRIFQAERRGEDLRPFYEEQMALHTLLRQIEQREFLKWNT